MGVYYQNIVCAFILIIAMTKSVAQEFVGTARINVSPEYEIGQCGRERGDHSS